MQHYLDLFNSIPTGFWQLLVTSPILSGILKALKSWLDKLKEWQIYILSVAGAAIVVIGNYLLHTPTSNPRWLIAQGAILSFTTTSFYILAVKPVSNKVGGYVTERAAAKQVLQSAIEPAGGVPISPASMPIGPLATDTTPMGTPLNSNDFGE